MMVLIILKLILSVGVVLIFLSTMIYQCHLMSRTLKEFLKILGR
jgi:Na+-transporting methylmalonyl-CoA/oxaloacetate decarboxylase gamma subunit